MTWLVPILAALIGPIGFATPKTLAALMPVLAVVLALRTGLDWRAPFRSNPLIWAVVAWSLLGGLWAIDPGHTALRAIRLAGEAFAGLYVVARLPRLDAAERDRTLVAGLAGLTFGGLFVLADMASGAALTRWGRDEWDAISLANAYSRGATLEAILLAPLALACWRLGHRLLTIAACLIGLVTLVSLLSWSAQLAFAAGIAAFLVVLAVPALRWLVVAGQVGLVIVMPWAFPIAMDSPQVCGLIDRKPSAVHRLMIWNFTADRIAERPLLGWGIESSRSMPHAKEKVDIVPCRPGAAPIATVERLPLHPHNGALHVRLELGLVGALLTAAALLAALLAGYRQATGRVGLAAVASSSMAAYSVAMVSFGLWQGWWLAALFLTGGLVGAVLKQES